ncbi:MAG TPA: hypothetical protein VFN53_06425 [Acidobacteriaceae bacterium]|nr:hypothetical protein [Acidobacteriaceae bacterium]
MKKIILSLLFLAGYAHAQTMQAPSPSAANLASTLSATPQPLTVSGPSGTNVLVAPAWTRKGLTLIGSGEPTVLQDTNAQLLAVPSTTTIFKAWFTNGTGPGIYYAESLDGLTNWTYDSTVLLNNYARSFVLHNGSTYYLYAVPMPAQNSIDLYTSTNGTTFTLAKSGVITLGASGAWDSVVLANMSVIVDGSTWRMLYEAAGGGDFQIGTATSPDGQTWTKYASNPVMGQQGVMSAGGPWLWKDPQTGTFWAWAHVSFPGPGQGDLPTDGARFTSTDFNTWTMNPAALTLPRLSYAEGARNLGGQIADLSLLPVGNSTYVYFAAINQQNCNSGACGIHVATAPMTLHQLVSTDEGATLAFTALSNLPIQSSQALQNDSNIMSASGTTTDFAINQNNVVSWHLRNMATSGFFELNDGGANVFTCDPLTGYCGLGTTSAPAQQLEVNGNAQVDGNLMYLNTMPLYGSSSNRNMLFGSSATPAGADNTGVGLAVLGSVTSGTYNTALGRGSLYSATTANGNVGVGYHSLYWNSTGADNTAIGFQAGFSVSGGAENTIGADNTLIGASVSPLDNGDTNETVVGYNAVGNGSNTVTLGDSSVTGTFLHGTVNATSVATTNMTVSGNSVLGVSEGDVSVSGAVTLNATTTVKHLLLTGNVTGVTIPAGQPGFCFTLYIIENSTGGYTWVYPSNMIGGMQVDDIAGATNSQNFCWSNADSLYVATNPGTSVDMFNSAPVPVTFANLTSLPASSWSTAGGACCGNSTATGSDNTAFNVAGPSLSGSALELVSVTNSGSPYGYNVQADLPESCSVLPGGTCTGYTHALMDVWTFVPSASHVLQGMEGPNLVTYTGTNQFYPSLQCATHGSSAITWQVWNSGAGTWETTGIDCSAYFNSQNTWHHIQIEYVMDFAANTYYYGVMALDGKQVFNNPLGSYSAKADTADAASIKPQYQVDAQTSSTAAITSEFYIDKYNVTIY